MIRRLLLALVLIMAPEIALSATPPAAWTPQNSNGAVVYNSDGTVCNWGSGGNCGAGGGGGSPSSSTAATTSVSGTASPTTCLALNTNRKGATVANDSTAIMYLLLGSGTVSSTVYTVQLVGNANGVAYYEVPFGFTGALTCLWASATGAARVTEFQ